MNKRYIFIAIAVATVVIAGLLLKGFSTTNDTTPGSEPTMPISKGGWVEILSGRTFLIENIEGSESKKELATGASVVEGNILETDNNGKAAIHFFDGSVLRISPSTRITIKSAEYDKDSGRILVKASLSFGKAWSKIIELATPDSLWQVETSNTVATVRGSAFGVSSDGKNSEIFGSQHKVVVEVIDPNTKEKLKIQPLVVSDGNFLKIADADVQKIKAIEERASAAAPAEKAAIMKAALLVLAPVKIDEKIKSDEWFKGNENDDKKVEEEIKKAKEEVGNDQAEFRKHFNKKVEDRLVEEKSKIETPQKEEIKDERAKDKVEPVKVIELQKVPEKWNSLKIETKGHTGSLVEEDIVAFKAVLYGEGGVSKDVTSEAKWEVSGKMGSMDKPGIFSAKLDPEISEFGEGDGFINATWEGPDGNSLHSKSDLIHVILKIEDNMDERG